MVSLGSSLGATLARPFSAWRRFLFQEVDPAPLAALRIAFGAYLVIYYLSYFPLLHLEFFPPAAMTPGELPKTLGGFLLARAPYTIFGRYALFGLTLLAALALGLGSATRFAALLTWLLHQAWMSFPVGKNSGDGVVGVVAFLFVLTALAGHAQRAYSMDAGWPKAEDTPRIPAWPLRLFQVQLVFIYFFSGFHKLAANEWYTGEAMFYVFQQDVWSRWDMSFLTHPVAVGLLTYGTLLFELVIFPVLVWPRATRGLVLVAGVLFHFGIAATMRVFVFGEIMPIVYLAFVDTKPWLEAAARRIERWRRTSRPRAARARPRAEAA